MTKDYIELTKADKQSLDELISETITAALREDFGVMEGIDEASMKEEEFEELATKRTRQFFELAKAHLIEQIKKIEV